MDLRTTQLKDTYGNLVTTGTSAGSPTEGGLQNGDGQLLTAVGIGTNTPSAPLSIDTGTTGTLAQFRGADTDILNIDADSNAIVLDARNVAYLGFEMQGSESMRIDSSGNVGIGATSVTSSFRTEIAGGDFRVGDTQGEDAVEIGWSAGDTQGFVQAYDRGDSAFRDLMLNASLLIESGGNVGIGTDTIANPFSSAYSNVLEVGTTSGNTRLAITAGTSYSSDFNFADSNTSSESGTYAGYISYKHTSDSMVFGTATSESMRIDSDGNVLVGTTATPTSSAGNIVLGNGTAPTGNATDGVILYAEDVSTSSELKVRDEAGNVTTLSPHNFSLIPDGASEPMAWAYYSERDGKKINVDMLKLARMVESLTGEKLVYEQ